MKQVVTPLYPLTGSKTNFDKGMIWVKKFSVFLIICCCFLHRHALSDQQHKYLDSYNNTMKAETLRLEPKEDRYRFIRCIGTTKEVLEGFK